MAVVVGHPIRSPMSAAASVGFGESADLTNAAPAAPERFVDLTLGGTTSTYNPATRLSTGGTDDGYDSIASAITAATAGDLIYVRGDTHTSSWTINKSDIEIAGYQSERPVINDAIGGPAISIDAQSGVTMRRIDCIDAAGFGHIYDCSDMLFDDLDMRNTKGSGTTASFKIVRTVDSKVINSNFENGDADLMVLQDASDGNVIENNTFTAAGHSLMSLRCVEFNVIRGNTFDNDEQKCVEVYDCEGVSDAPVRLDSAKQNLFENNIFKNTPDDVDEHSFNAIQLCGQRGLYRFNEIYDCLGGGFTLQEYSDEALYNYENHIYNNVFVANECRAISNDGTTSSTDYRDHKVVNNLLVNNTACDGSPGQLNLSNAIIDNRTNTEWLTDPGFVNMAGRDLQLTPVSTMNGAGSYVTTVDGAVTDSTTFVVDDPYWFFDGYSIIGEVGDLLRFEGTNTRARITSINYGTATITVDNAVTLSDGQGVHTDYAHDDPSIGAQEAVLETMTASASIAFSHTAALGPFGSMFASTSIAFSETAVISGGTPYVGFGSVTNGADDNPGGKTTYSVTNLNDNGAGSFRDAVSVSGREITFDVGGEIELLSWLNIEASYLTIDGSSAPSPGITLDVTGQRLVLESNGSDPVHDIIINNIRAYGNGIDTEALDLWELDGSSGWPVYNVIIDHCTMIASSDGMVDMYGDVHDVTVSNCLFMDSIQGQHFSQASGTRDAITWYRNVYTGVSERQTRIRYNTTRVDWVNNVVYGWGWQAAGGVGFNPAAGGPSYSPSVNCENNIFHYVSGLNGSGEDDALADEGNDGDWYYNGNDWPPGETDAVSTSGQVTIPAQYKVERLPINSLAANVVPNVGTHYPTAGETSDLNTVSAAIGTSLFGSTTISFSQTGSLFPAGQMQSSTSINFGHAANLGPNQLQGSASIAFTASATPVQELSEAFSYAGVPYPTTVNSTLQTLGLTLWNYDPFLIEPAALPSPWTSNTTGFFFVEQGGTNGGNGYPGDPAGDLPGNGAVSAGDVIVLSELGGNITGNKSRSYTGGSSDPVMVVARSATKPKFTGSVSFSGSTHTVVEGFEVDNQIEPVFAMSGDFVTVRDCKLVADEDGWAGNGPGNCVTFDGDNSVMYNTEITSFINEGNWPSSDEDYHGHKGYGTNKWIIDCDIHHIQGDGIQFANAGDPNSSNERVYIAGCTIHHCYQTSVWIKAGIDIVISSNTFYSNHSSGGGSTPAGCGGQYDFVRAWFINNLIYDNGAGIKIASANNTGANHIYMVGNIIRDGTSAGYDPNDSWSNHGITYTNDNNQEVYAILNTIHNYPGGMSTPRQGVNYSGNFIDDPTNGSGNHLYTAGGEIDADYNCYRGSTAKLSGTINGDANSITTATPGFVNEGANNFLPDTGSALLDIVPDTGVIQTVFDRYNTRYGIDLRFDNANNPRFVNTDADIGALEKQ